MHPRAPVQQQAFTAGQVGGFGGSGGLRCRIYQACRLHRCGLLLHRPSTRLHMCSRLRHRCCCLPVRYGTRTLSPIRIKKKKKERSRSTMTLQPPPTTNWYMGSGASSHMTSNSHLTYPSFFTPSNTIVDGSLLPISFTGHAHLPTSHGPMHLNDVLVSPNIINDLIFPSFYHS